MVQSRMLLGLYIVILSCRLGFGQEPDSRINMILELPAEDDLTFDNDTIIKECSKLLANREKHDIEIIAKALVARGTAFIATSKLIEARTDFDELCTLEPKNSVARCLRAEVHASLGDHQQAQQDSATALTLDPKSPQAHVSSAMRYIQRGDIRKSLELLDKAVALDEKYAVAYYIRAVLLEQRDPVICLESINKFLELHPYPGVRTSGEPYYIKGYILSNLNRPREALSCFLMARKVNPKSAKICRELAITYADLQRFHLAYHYAEEYSKLDPTSPVGYALAAKYHASAGNAETAVEASKQALRLANGSASIRCLVGDAYFQMGQYAGAHGEYQASLNTSPNLRQALVAMASFQATCPEEKFRDGAQAVKHAKAALEEKGLRVWQKWEPEMALAEALAETGAFDEAIRYAKEAIEVAGPEFGGRSEFLKKLASFEKKMPWRPELKVRSKRP